MLWVKDDQDLSLLIVDDVYLRATHCVVLKRCPYPAPKEATRVIDRLHEAVVEFWGEKNVIPG